MNLVTGIEDSSTAFSIVTAGSAVLGALVVAGFHASLKHHARIEERARLAADDRVALASLLANMATIEHLFDKTQVGDTVLTKDDMRSLVEAATGTAPSRREVELLFDIFDSSRDELIHPHEARNALSGKHGD